MATEVITTRSAAPRSRRPGRALEARRVVSSLDIASEPQRADDGHPRLRLEHAVLAVGHLHPEPQPDPRRQHVAALDRVRHPLARPLLPLPVPVLYVEGGDVLAHDS